MKDKWISAFQEKMGDWEFDIPTATPRRHKRWLVLLPGAAAAVLLAVLLLRMPDAGTPPENSPQRRIAEAPVPIAAMRPDRAIAALRPERRPERRGSQSAQSTQCTKSEHTAIQGPVDPTGESLAAPGTEETVPTGPDKPDVPAASDMEWFETEPVRNKAGFSARLHINPLGLQANTPLSSKHDAAHPLPTFFDEKSLQYIINVTDYANREVTPVKHNTPEVHCDLPVKTGLSLRIEGVARFSLESGLNYGFHRAWVQHESNTFPAYRIEYRMHYLGIPLKLIGTLAEWERLHLYAAAGAEAEWMVAGRILTQAGGQILARQRLQEHPFLFSLTAAAGAEYKFNTRLGLYAEPGIAWHFKPQGDLPNYYREHPLSFDLHLGFRFTL